MNYNELLAKENRIHIRIGAAFSIVILLLVIIGII